MKNKKTIMAFAALQIVVFHLWIYVFPGCIVELFLKQTAYIGVDIFFLLSAYSLAGRKIDNYRDFELSRFRDVYMKFAAFAVIACILKHWSAQKLMLTVTGVNLWQKGGGSFLWFLPAIMLFYVLFPFYQRLCQNHFKATMLVTLAMWLGIGAAVTELSSYRAMFIFWNRIPAIATGLCLAKSESFDALLKDRKKCLTAGMVLLVAGTALIYMGGFRPQLNYPVYSFFYLLGLPAAVGIIMIITLLPELEQFKVIGSSTLEMYGVQMVFGYSVSNRVYVYTGSPLVTNIISIGFVILFAVILRKADDLIKRKKNDSKL